MTSRLREGKELFAYQISTRYLNPRPSYYYFRFLKSNGRHLEILLLVSILTFSLLSACDSALAYQILCKSDDRRRSYDVILILQDGGHGVTNLLPVSGLATSHILEGPRLPAYQISTRYLNPRRDITTSGCWKQTSVIYTFYSRFRFWPFHRYRLSLIHISEPTRPY